MKDVYLHIGMPKTASRTFQYHYFTSHDGIKHIGKKKPDPSELEQEFIEVITDMERWEFKSAREHMDDRYSNDLFDGEKKYVVSAEAFSAGGGVSGKVDRYTIMKRLYDMFPNGQMVVVLRNQLDIIQSVYRHRLKSRPGIEPFESWIDTKREQSYKTTLFDYFDYNELIEMYRRHFGRENIHVLFFEQLVRNQMEFVESLSSVLGIRPSPELVQNKHENPSLRTVTLLWHRAKDNISALSVIPKLLPKRLKKRIKMTGSKIEVSYTDEQKEFLTRRYAESNRALRSELDIPLEKYGYPL